MTHMSKKVESWYSTCPEWHVLRVQCFIELLLSKSCDDQALLSKLLAYAQQKRVKYNDKCFGKLLYELRLDCLRKK